MTGTPIALHLSALARVKPRRLPARITRAWLQRWVRSALSHLPLAEETPYWLNHHECGDFCYDCGEKRRLELLALHPELADGLRSLDGGWSTESDGCRHCDTCGVLLEYTLTDYGAESEWDHFKSYGIHLNSVLDAAHIGAVLENGMALDGLNSVQLFWFKSPLRRALAPSA